MKPLYIVGSAGYTATYWANKIVDGVVKADEFTYLGEEEFDAIFQEKVTVHPRDAALAQKSVKGKKQLVKDFGETYLFDHADYSADTTADFFEVDSSHTQSVKVYYKPYLGPNPPSPQEAAFTVTYLGLSIEAAKAGGTHVRTDYTDTLTTIKFGAWPDAKININYQEPLAPNNKVNQIIPGFTLNADLVDINGSATTTPWELDLATAAKQTGNTITLYYDRDVYDPPSGKVGYKINHMVQSLEYLLHGIGEEYVCEQTDLMKAVYKETVQGSYDGNADMKDKIDAFMDDNKTESGEYGFTLREVDPISPASLYIDKPDTYEFYVYYDRGLDDKYTFKTQRMIKNPDFITGTSDVEYLAFEDPQECYPLYKQEVVDATCTERIWTPIEGYTFENRCNPDSIDIPQTPGNLLKASANAQDLGTIQGFYDLTVYPPHEDITAQTGDVLAGIIGALAVTGLVGLGLFLAMNRRKNRYVPKH